MNTDWFKYFIGRDFWVGLTIVPIVLAAKLFLGIFYNLSVWYKLTDKTLYGGLIALFGATVTILLNIILIPSWGYIGSAWANFACYFSMALISYFLGKRFYKIDYDVKKISGYSFLALFIFALSRFLNLDTTFHRIAAGFVLISVYVLVVYIFERKSFLNIKG